MTKDTSSSRNTFPYLVILASVGAALLIAVIYFIVMQAQQVTALQVSLHQMKEDVQKIAQKPEKPSLFNDPDSFNRAVIGAFEGYVKEQQKEAVRAKEAKYANAVTVTPDGKHIYGSLQARFTLVEFSDFECSFCKRFHETPKRIVDSSKGMVNWQWKHLPLGFHNPASQVQAQAAECVAELGDNRKFWMFLEEVFKSTRGGGQGVADLVGVATSIGIEDGAFRECMQSGRHQAKVDEDVAQATKFGINGTPATFIVDNQTGNSQLVSGAQPEQALLSAISKLAEESKNDKSKATD